MTVERTAQRVLILAPVGRDAELMCTHLARAGIDCVAFTTMEEFCEALDDGADVLLFTEEALPGTEAQKLARALEKQPPWSELPIIILTGLPELEAKTRSFPDLRRRTNITLLDRPLRIQSLISAVQTALNARARQYEIRDLMKKLEERVHERDRFLAILGHELRNPLGAILLASQLIEPEDGKLPGEHAVLIERQSRHLTRIVNDLLDLSRVVSGKIVIKPQLIDLRQIAQQSLATVEESARTHAVEVTMRMPETPLLVHADPVRADQILNNVLTNAIKYTPEGGHVDVLLEQQDGQAVIHVRDDGVGIASDRLGTIFELFAQAENAIGRSQGGMGIGLALVRNLVDLHGGSVSVASDGVERGSEFTIRLPLAPIGATTELPPARSLEPQARRRIVIVEDNTDVRELLRLRLRKLGHEVDAVADGVSGVRTIIGERPDLALIDIGLPRLDGYQVASQVRSQLGDDVVLIALSGFGQPEDKRRALEAGFNDHLTKPADVRDIEELLRRYTPSLTSER